MRFFRNRLRARITLESLVGVNAPLLVAGGYMAVRPEGADWTLQSVLGVVVPMPLAFSPWEKACLPRRKYVV